jgi:arabinofuranosyltransferase
LLPAAGLAVYTAVVVRCAWQSDDAYIGFRSAVNLVHGHGLVWNVAERVQAFTNALWILLAAGAYAVTGEVYYTTLALSMFLSVLALSVVLFGLARSLSDRLMTIALAVSSKSLVDYSTSGLELPPGVARREVDAVVVRPLIGDGGYALGRIEPLP